MSLDVIISCSLEYLGFTYLFSNLFCLSELVQSLLRYGKVWTALTCVSACCCILTGSNMTFFFFWVENSHLICFWNSDFKVEELEKEILTSREKIQFCSTKMQELVSVLINFLFSSFDIGKLSIWFEPIYHWPGHQLHAFMLILAR